MKPIIVGSCAVCYGVYAYARLRIGKGRRDLHLGVITPHQRQGRTDPGCPILLWDPRFISQNPSASNLVVTSVASCLLLCVMVRSWMRCVAAGRIQMPVDHAICVPADAIAASKTSSGNISVCCLAQTVNKAAIRCPTARPRAIARTALLCRRAIGILAQLEQNNIAIIICHEHIESK